MEEKPKLKNSLEEAPLKGTTLSSGTMPEKQVTSTTSTGLRTSIQSNQSLVMQLQQQQQISNITGGASSSTGIIQYFLSFIYR